MKKKAFVTGATGFLGLNLIEKLTSQNWEVIGFHLPGVDLNFLSGFAVGKIAGDLNNYESLVNAIPMEVDAVFHIAGNTSMWSKNNEQQYRDNVIGTQNIVNAAIEKKARRFIYTSSIAAYGYHKDPVSENTCSNAMTCNMNYNKTKYLAEQIVKEAVKKGLFAVILNPINVVGPYDVNNWTKQFIKPVYYDKLVAIPPGKAMWCHVKDVVNAHIQAVDFGEKGENYLLGGVEASFKEVVNEIERYLGKALSTKVKTKLFLRLLTYLLTIKSCIDGKEPMLTPAKYKRAVGSITCDYGKAIRVLNYQTSSLHEMIQDSFQWLHRENLL